VQSLFQPLDRQSIAQPLPAVPGSQDPVGEVEPPLDAPAPQRLDARVRNVEAQGQTGGAAEELAVDVARVRKQVVGFLRTGRAAGCQAQRRRVYELRILADFLSDIRFEQGLERCEREAQRQRLAQAAQRAAVELAQQPRVQARENARAVQRACGFTAR